jgi:hypothetical protein
MTGSYTARSAYLTQINGSFDDYECNKLWAAKAENKCKMFRWLILQNKVWTSDKVAKHGGQSNTICQLCRSQTGTAIHMLAYCPYSIRVWQQLQNWVGAPLQPPTTSNYRYLKHWWTTMISTPAMSNDNQRMTQKCIYIIWNLWKERCRRIFDNRVMTENQLSLQIKLDVQLWHTAHRTPNDAEALESRSFNLSL